jgi:hypothetical protein
MTLPKKSINDYPPYWPSIVKTVKEQADYRCECCGFRYKPKKEVILRVHHLDLDKANNEPWNLLVLCPPCYSLFLAQNYPNLLIHPNLFEPCPEWLKPHITGYLEYLNRKR